MKIENAIKKLSKYGKVQENGVEYWIERGNYIIGFLRNGETHICCEYTKRISSEAPERHYDNLTQAIDFVLRQEALVTDENGANIPCQNAIEQTKKAESRIGNVIINLLGREERKNEKNN